MVFRLASLHVDNHQIISDISFFQDKEKIENDMTKSPFCSMIIGPNGTGKSQILRLLIDIFRELNYIQRKISKKYYPSYRYTLSYILGKNRYQIESGKKGEKRYLKNNTEIDIDSLELPSSLLCSTALLNDKFIFPDKELDIDGFYNYLGLRKTTNSASTATYLKNVVESLIQLCDQKESLALIRKSLSFLNLRPVISIEFHPKYRSYFFNQKLTPELFKQFFENWKDTTRRENSPRSLNYLRKLSDQEINELIVCIERLKERIEVYTKSRTRYLDYEIDLNNIETQYKIINNFVGIKKLMKLDILSRPYLQLYKLNSDFDFEEASSGEFHFISTIIRILSVIKDNSIILIDEPENSLHPNWQMKFVNHLRDVFSKFPTCHFIISTHSHFMISDLKQESSSIISLKTPENGEKIIAMLHDQNTYGWSTEDILYNIFEMRTTRNYFIGIDIKNLLGLISNNSQEYDKIKGLLEKLKKLSLSQQDPLNIVLEKAEKYLENDTSTK